MTTQQNLPLIWAYSGGVKDPGDAKYTGGWVAEIPSYQNFNFVLKNLSTNSLVLAEQGMYNWEPTITYGPGGRVFDNDIVWTCISENTGEQPSLDSTNSYWVLGYQTGNAPLSSLVAYHGVRVKKVNSRTRNLWDGNDITLDNLNSTIMFKTDSTSDDNIILGNVAGELVVVNVGTTVNPDSRNISASGTGNRVFHEGHAPVQSEVAGTIPDAPNDGPIYGRSLTNWVKVTSTTVSTSPPPPVAGSGQGWYNLDDGTTYVDVDDGDSSQWVPASPPVLSDLATSNEINAGNNDKSIGPAALAGSDYVKEAYVDTRASVGYDQTWANNSSVRLPNVEYTNNTGRAIQLSVIFTGTSAVQNAALHIDGVLVSRHATNSGSSGTAATVSGIVPPGSVYVLKQLDNVAVYRWNELS